MKNRTELTDRKIRLQYTEQEVTLIWL